MLNSLCQPVGFLCGVAVMLPGVLLQSLPDVLQTAQMLRIVRADQFGGGRGRGRADVGNEIA